MNNSAKKRTIRFTLEIQTDGTAAERTIARFLNYLINGGLNRMIGDDYTPAQCLGNVLIGKVKPAPIEVA